MKTYPKRFTYQLKLRFSSQKVIAIPKNKMCVCKTHIPPIITNFKDGHIHKNKYLDTSRKVLSQEILMCNTKALIFIIKKSWPMLMFKQNRSCEVRNAYYRKFLSQGIFIESPKL